MAIIKTGSSAVLPLDLASLPVAPLPASGGAAAPSGPSPAAGFHLLFQGSLQAQGARTLAPDDGKSLPPGGEVLPDSDSAPTPEIAVDPSASLNATDTMPEATVDAADPAPDQQLPVTSAPPAEDAGAEQTLPPPGAAQLPAAAPDSAAEQAQAQALAVAPVPPRGADQRAAAEVAAPEVDTLVSAPTGSGGATDVDEAAELRGLAASEDAVEQRPGLSNQTPKDSVPFVQGEGAQADADKVAAQAPPAGETPKPATIPATPATPPVAGATDQAVARAAAAAVTPAVPATAAEPVVPVAAEGSATFGQTPAVRGDVADMAGSGAAAVTTVTEQPPHTDGEAAAERVNQAGDLTMAAAAVSRPAPAVDDGRELNAPVRAAGHVALNGDMQAGADKVAAQAPPAGEAPKPATIPATPATPPVAGATDQAVARAAAAAVTPAVPATAAEPVVPVAAEGSATFGQTPAVRGDVADMAGSGAAAVTTVTEQPLHTDGEAAAERVNQAGDLTMAAAAVSRPAPAVDDGRELNAPVRVTASGPEEPVVSSARQVQPGAAGEVTDLVGKEAQVAPLSNRPEGPRLPTDPLPARQEGVTQAMQLQTSTDTGDTADSGQQSRQEGQNAAAAAAMGRTGQATPAAVTQAGPTFAQQLQQQLAEPRWGRQLGERAIMMAQHGPRTAHIQLDPPELGAMQIRVHLQGQDQVSVSFTSANPAVRDALEQQLPRLREMFADQGLNLQDSSVSDEASRQGSGQREQADSFGRSGGYGSADSGDAEAMPAPAVALGLVDYYA